MPFFPAVEVLCLTEPTAQWELAIFDLALPTVIPTTFGTTQGASRRANRAVTVRLAVIDTTQFRVLRDYAEPGATRRMHNHPDATYHVFVLITGRLLLTVQGEPPVEVGPGEALSLKGGAMHTFRNTGEQTATIVEVFGKGPGVAADVAVDPL